MSTCADRAPVELCSGDGDVCVCVSVCAGFVGEVSIVTLIVGGKRLYYFEEPFPAPLSLASVWNSAQGREGGKSKN